MVKTVKATSVFALGVIFCASAFGQAQVTPMFSRDNCIKVREGKRVEYAAYLRDVVLKLSKVRVDAGEIALFTVARAVVPAGRSAGCDYHLVSTYNGFPPELSGREMTEADMKKAGITMSLDAMRAKRGELSFLVGTNIWRWQERVGKIAKGSYLRLNYFKVQAGRTGEWVRMESTGWKPLAEAALKENPGYAWRAATLIMPGGANLPYNGMTIDVFPSWAALGKGIPVRTLWNKVHPDSDMASYSNRMATFTERPRIDVFYVVELLEKQ